MGNIGSRRSNSTEDAASGRSRFSHLQPKSAAEVVAFREWQERYRAQQAAAQDKAREEAEIGAKRRGVRTSQPLPGVTKGMFGAAENTPMRDRSAAKPKGLGKLIPRAAEKVRDKTVKRLSGELRADGRWAGWVLKGTGVFFQFGNGTMSAEGQMGRAIPRPSIVKATLAKLRLKR